MPKAYLRPALAWLIFLGIGAIVYMTLPNKEGPWYDRTSTEEVSAGKDPFSLIYKVGQQSSELFFSPDARLSYEQFSGKWKEYKNGKTSAADMLALCDRVLAVDAAGNATYRARVYTSRGFIFFDQKNIAEAEANARLAMTEDSRRGFGQYLLYYIRESQGRAAEAADMLEAAWNGGHLTMAPGKIKENIARLRAAAVVIDSRDLEAEFAADAAAANRKYAGKNITVRGKVLGIDAGGFTIFELEGSLPGHNIFCAFFVGGMPGIKGITEGQTVTVYGDCLGLFSLGELHISDCKIIKVEP